MDMESSKAQGSLRGFIVCSFALGILGGVFYWWVPLGMVLSLTGLVFGFADWTMARRRSLDSRLSVAAILLSIATLALDVAIALLGLQTITFGRG